MRNLIVSSVLVGVSVSGLAEMYNLAKGVSQTAAPPSTSQIVQQNTSASTSGQTTIPAPSGYFYLAPLSALSGKTYAYFNHPSEGSAIIINVSNQWKAFSATCTHRPCTINYSGSSLNCPCHGGSFSTANGSVTGGPPPSPLAEFGVQTFNGSVFVSNSRIN